MKDRIKEILATHPGIHSAARMICRPFFYLRGRKARRNVLEEGSKIGAGSVVERSYFGYYSGCNKNCNIMDTFIGRYVNIGPGVIIGQRNHIYTNFTTHDFVYRNNEHIRQYSIFGSGGGRYGVKLGHDVWVGAGAIICNRVEIGNGAVIAAGAVVTKSVPAYTVVAGTPARIIARRFPEDVAEKLEATKWYLLTKEEVIRRSDALSEITGFDMEEYWKGYMQQREWMR